MRKAPLMATKSSSLTKRLLPSEAPKGATNILYLERHRDIGSLHASASLIPPSSNFRDLITHLICSLHFVLVLLYHFVASNARPVQLFDD